MSESTRRRRHKRAPWTVEDSSGGLEVKREPKGEMCAKKQDEARVSDAAAVALYRYMVVAGANSSVFGFDAHKAVSGRPNNRTP